MTEGQVWRRHGPPVGLGSGPSGLIRHGFWAECSYCPIIYSMLTHSRGLTYHAPCFEDLRELK